MYGLIKQFISFFLGKRTLVHYEPAARKLLYQFFKGNKYTCNICGKGLRKFVKLQNGDRLCSLCGSLARNRRLYALLKEEFSKRDFPNVLEFSPSRCLYRAFKADASIQYTATDFANEFISEKKLDITNIGEPSESYDVVICYHILEHIDADTTAMRELRRITKAQGVCFIQAPFKDGGIYEDATIKTPQEREKHFGQNDHVRIYSVDGLVQRLRESGWKVEVKQFEEKENNRYGFNEREVVLVASPDE